MKYVIKSTYNQYCLLLQLQKIENRVKKYGDDNVKQKYELIYNELMRLDRIFYKVTIDKFQFNQTIILICIATVFLYSSVI